MFGLKHVTVKEQMVDSPFYQIILVLFYQLCSILYFIFLNQKLLW